MEEQQYTCPMKVSMRLRTKVTTNEHNMEEQQYPCPMKVTTSVPFIYRFGFYRYTIFTIYLNISCT